MGEFGVRVYKEYFNFAAAHFLIFADGTREELHGHNYRVRVSVTGDLDAGDVVLDFIPWKPIVKRVCDRLDHKTILPSESKSLAIERRDGAIEVRHGEDRFVFPERDVVLLPLPNTSTERLAEHLGRTLAREARERFPGARLRAIEVEVEESSGQAGFWREALNGPLGQ